MRARRFTRAVGVVSIVTSLLVSAGCARPKIPTTDNGTVLIRLYGSDGNMRDTFGDALKDQPGILAGMKGVAPLTPLSEDFKRRLRSVDKTLTDFRYSGEAYDAVVIAALASELAGTADPAVVARYIAGVTVGGTVCDSTKACLDLAEKGEDIQYRGVSLRRSGFTDVGEPSTAMYATLQFGRDNHLSDGKTEFVGAGDDHNQSTAVAPSPSAWPPPPPPPRRAPSGSPSSTSTPYRPPPPPPLKIGGLLPHTGASAAVGPAQFAGARLAIQEINEYGGVGDNPVQWLDGDDGSSGDVAASTVDRLVANGVDVIIGAGSSTVTQAVLPKVVAAGKIMISASATSDTLTTVDDKGLFFRTSPPDALQAKALSDVVMRDGSQRIVVVARDDTYGTGLSHNLQASLTAGGVKAANIEMVPYRAAEKYDPVQDLAAVFGPVARSIKEFAPDSIVIIGYDESALVIKAILAEGVKLRG
jgi:ABC-type branched-subunit amino acid transport system substrate-binding protein